MVKKLSCIDTDSFIAYIKTDDIYKDIAEDVEDVNPNTSKQAQEVILILSLFQFVFGFVLFPRYWKYTVVPGNCNIFCFICLSNEDLKKTVIRCSCWSWL